MPEKDPIAKLLGGKQRTKLLRLFAFNPGALYDKDEAAKRIRTTPTVASRELYALVRLGVLRKKQYFKQKEAGVTRVSSGIKKRVVGFTLETRFPYVDHLRDFLLNTLPISYDEIVRSLRPYGKLRMVVLSGFFQHHWDSRLDILIIGDKLYEQEVAHEITILESYLGRELRYTCLSTEEYRYRVSIQDRLIRDVFDYEHEIIFDRMEV